MRYLSLLGLVVVLGLAMACDGEGRTAAQTPMTPVGDIAATDVQAGLAELDSEKLALAGGTMSGAIDMDSNAISNASTVNGGTLSGNNSGDQAASDFNHDDLSNITGTVGEYNHPDDADMTVLGNTSNTNSGDQDLSGYLLNTTDEFTGTLTLTGTLDLGTNTIADAIMTGDWDFGSGNLTTKGKGQFVGIAGGAGTETVTLTNPGIITGGVSNSNAGGSVTLSSTGLGSFTSGYIINTLATDEEISATDKGAVAIGYAIDSSIKATFQGAVAMGSTAGSSSIESTGGGTFAQGQSDDHSLIKASSSGGVAMGSADDNGNILAEGSGAFCQGIAEEDAYIRAGSGAFAQGRAIDATIQASHSGSFAHGNTDRDGDILATAVNAAQFGVGENNVEDSLQLGTYDGDHVRIHKSGNIDATGSLIVGGVLNLAGYTVATLPAGSQGDTAFVTDATAPTYLATLTGGGAVVCPVFYNGSAWVSH